MSTPLFPRLVRRLSSLLGVAAVGLASTSASARPAAVKICHPTQLVSNPALLSGCTDIVGDVHIERTNAKTLTALSALRRVAGTLVIADNPSLTSLEGLAHLSSVEGLIISDNPALEAVDGLDDLARAPHLEVAGNHALSVLEGPNRLKHVDELTVRDNALFRVTGFRSLVSAGNVVIARNSRLIYTSGLSRLVSVENLSLVHNPRLAPVTMSFGSPPTVRKELVIRGCPGISLADLRDDG
jgi:hypothetical protein